MIDVGIIEPIEESDWINPMVVHDNKTREIDIYVDKRKLNDASLHDTFLKPFDEKLLGGVGGQEIYSFIDKFSSYN